MDLPVAAGAIVANKYRVQRRIGVGGMGVVVAAVHLELDQPVAIKFLNSGGALRADAVERFRREARAAAKICSEHVARVLDIGLLDDTVPYMVMELLEGNDLEREVERRGRIPLAEAADYVLQAIDAIAEAHSLGIVHRDLKPTNLYLALRADGTRLLKVLDFGVSKLLSTQGLNLALTDTGSLVGSPLYMSPEQMRSSRDVDVRADIWSLGAILYELVGGQPPFPGESLAEVAVGVLNEPPPPIRSLCPEASPALEAVLAKCLAKDRVTRFASVAELADALLAFAPGSAVHAERARRLLGGARGMSVASASGSVLSPMSAAAAPFTMPSAGVNSAPVDRAFAVSAPNAGAALEPAQVTHSAWGHTAQGTRSRWQSRTLIACAFVAVAGLAVAAERALRASPAPALDTAASAAQPTEARVSAAVVTAAPAPTTTPLPEAHRAPSATAAPGLLAVPSASSGRQRPAPEERARAAKGRARSAETAATPRKGSALVSDFGGRR